MVAENLYRVAVTAIVAHQGRFLITRRSQQKEKWPGKWTVPGGKLEASDYRGTSKDAVIAWYNVVERTVRREVREEAGLEIDRLRYLTSIIAEYERDEVPSLIISLMAEYASGELALEEGELDKAAWVSAAEAREYDLIDGIYDELVMAEALRAGENTEEWRRADA